MRKSDGKQGEKTPWLSAKGPQASRLRQRKYAVSRELGLPSDLLGGSLVVSRRQCGRQNCWCAQDDGHEQATLTYSIDGAKHVQNIPFELLEPVLAQVELGNRYRDAVKELRAVNAQLLRLWLVEQREKRSKTKRKKASQKKKVVDRRSRS
jgi:hypothetical protein